MADLYKDNIKLLIFFAFDKIQQFNSNDKQDAKFNLLGMWPSSEGCEGSGVGPS